MLGFQTPVLPRQGSNQSQDSNRVGGQEVFRLSPTLWFSEGTLAVMNLCTDR